MQTLHTGAQLGLQAPQSVHTADHPAFIAPVGCPRRSHRRHEDSSMQRDVRAHHRSHEFSLWRGEVPVPKGWSKAVVPGARTVATQLLSAEKVVERLQRAVHPVAEEHFGAFYSSELGGIVTDPAMMFIHADDHMVHRGHSVFDTALITDAHMYQLEEHFTRFKASAAAAGLSLPKKDEAIKRIILDTAAASRKLNGIAKFWVSAGRGGFGLSTRECTEPSFYVMVTSEVVPKMKALDKLTGYRGCITEVPPAGNRFATVKSTNYLRNALAQLEAETQGYDVALFVDSAGFIQEGPNMNLGIITQQDEFITPPFEGCLAGVTIQRLMQLIPEEAKRSPDDVVVSKVSQRPLKVEDLLAAKEAFLVGSTLRVMPLVSIGEELIADGTPGITALAFDTMLVNDQAVTPESLTNRHMPIPYGFMTGMKEHMT